ncbi:MAG: methylmalonyl-CoA mutase family protein, partial [Deltaproteobacteria bacterium]
VIHLESNVSKVTDPLGGSYYLEALTDQVEKRIRDMLAEIEAKGDPAELSDKGWFKKFLDDAMERYSRRMRDREALKVGVNVHRIPDEEDTLLKEIVEQKIEPCLDHIQKIKDYKAARDRNRLRTVLQDVHEAAKSEEENLMYPILAATEAGATMGEIAGVMRTAHGFPYDPHGLIDSPLE